MVEDLTNYFVASATIAVAIATFLLWRSTTKVAEATSATKDVAKEVGSYSIMPRFEVVSHEKNEQEGYDHCSFKLINIGKDTAYNVRVQISAEKKSGRTECTPFNLEVGYQIHLSHSVDKNERFVHFEIDFEDVVGNNHKRKLTYEITKEKLMGNISWQLNKPFPDSGVKY